MVVILYTESWSLIRSLDERISYLDEDDIFSRHQIFQYQLQALMQNYIKQLIARSALNILKRYLDSHNQRVVEEPYIGWFT